MRLQADDYRGPVTEVGNSGIEKIAGAGEKAGGQCQHQKIMKLWRVALRLLGEEPKNFGGVKNNEVVASSVAACGEASIRLRQLQDLPACRPRKSSAC